MALSNRSITAFASLPLCCFTGVVTGCCPGDVLLWMCFTSARFETGPPLSKKDCRVTLRLKERMQQRETLERYKETAARKSEIVERERENKIKLSQTTTANSNNFN